MTPPEGLPEKCQCRKPARSYGNSCGKCGKDVPLPEEDAKPAISLEKCMRLAELEGDHTVGAGFVKEDAKTERETPEIEYYHFTGAAGMKRHPDGIWVRRSVLSAARAEVGTWEAEVKSVIDHLPTANVIRCCEGGGPENLAGTLALSVMSIREENSRLRDQIKTLLNLHDGTLDGGEGITESDWNAARELLPAAPESKGLKNPQQF